MPALSAGEPIRVALMSDLHWGTAANTNQPTYRLHLEQAIAAINEARVAFVLIAGDLTEKGEAAELEEVKAKLGSLKAPFFCVPGNHDVGSKIIPQAKAKKGGVTAQSIAPYEAVFGPASYVRQLAGVKVVGINAALPGSGLPEEAALWQLLEKEFAAPSALPTLLLTHYPLYLKDAEEPGGTYWNMEPVPRQKLLALLPQGGVKAVLSGHLHHPITNTFAGIPMISTVPISFALQKSLVGWTLLLVQANGEIQHEFKYGIGP